KYTTGIDLRGTIVPTLSPNYPCQQTRVKTAARTRHRIELWNAPGGLEPPPGFTRSVLRVVSASSPSRDNSRGRASISPNDVWKFTVQDMNPNLPPVSDV